MNYIDPTLYGGKPLGEEFVPPAADGSGSVVQPTPANPVTLDQTFAGSRVAGQGASVRLAADRERASILESVGASMMLWDTARLYDRITAPSFERDESFSLYDWVSQVPDQFAEHEMNYLRGAVSADSAQYRLGVIQDQRRMAEAAGDHPVFSFLTGAIDPVYLVATPLVSRGAKAFGLGRAGAGIGAAGAAVGIQTAGEGPVDEASVVLNALFNFAGGAAVYQPGKGIVKADPDFPDAALHAAATGVADRTVPKLRMRPDGIPEVVPEVAKVIDPVSVEHTVQIAFNKTVGDKLQWNMRKTLSGYGPVGQKVANLLFDNNSDLSITSVEAERAAVRSDFTAIQRKFEDGLLDAMAERGVGFWKTMTSPKAAAAVQADIEKQVTAEMLRREKLERAGRPITFENVNPTVKKLADHLDELHPYVLKELQAAGVEGAADLISKRGWFHRVWSSSKVEEATAKFKLAGLTDEAAHTEVVKLVAKGLRKANQWDSLLAYDVGAAIVNRALRKGYFEDALFNAPAGEGTLKMMRDILNEERIQPQRIERILDVLRQQADDGGKAGFMKHRVDIDHEVSTSLNGQTISIMDLLDTRMANVVDKYLDGASTQVAFARKGLKKASDIEDLRTELLRDIKDPLQREEAKNLFDNTIAHFRGQPAGASVNPHLRLMGAYGRMISLANSGLWQATEYATMMKEYGALKTIKYAVKEMPGFRQLLKVASSDKVAGQDLHDVLARHSDQNLRLRPYIHRFEDNFEMGMNDGMHLAANQAGQLVPYLNAMKYIHSHQARVSANLIVNRLEKAAKGDAKAIAALQKYGIESQVVDKLRAAVAQHGSNVDAWGDSVWRSVRPAFAKMMDEAVLHQRLGDMPAFAAFDPVGKFIFTYRSFVLTAHNKVLAGGIARDGLGAVSLMLMYQFPMAAAAVQAQYGLQGKGEISEKELAAKALSQMGGFGFFSELFGVISGQKNQFGAPGLIPIDRAISLVNKAARGDVEGVGTTAAQMVPLLGVLQPVKALSNLDK